MYFVSILSISNVGKKWIYQSKIYGQFHVLMENFIQNQNVNLKEFRQILQVLCTICEYKDIITASILGAAFR